MNTYQTFTEAAMYGGLVVLFWIGYNVAKIGFSISRIANRRD